MLICTDLDGTLVGDDVGLYNFTKFWIQNCYFSTS